MMTARASRFSGAAIAAAALLTACQGNVGTIGLTIVTAPGSTVMDSVDSARLTLSDPLTVIEAERDANGNLVLDIEVIAEGTSAFARFDGFDSNGELVALGITPVLPIAAIDAEIKIYVAAPGSIAAAPVPMETPRSEMGVGLLSFGVLYAGGRDASGGASDALTIYNAYDHTFQAGEPLPFSRVAPSMGSGASGQMYIFGGLDSAEAATADLWRFDTNVAPRGAYFDLRTSAEYARSHAAAALIGFDKFVVAGDPVLAIDGLNGGMEAYGPASDFSFEGATATSVLFANVLYTLVAGSNVATTGSVMIRAEIATQLDGPAELARDGHASVVLANGDILVLGGESTTGPLSSAVRFNAIRGEFSVIVGLLATPRTEAAIASTGTYVLVAGGVDELGALVPTVELFDGDTLTSLGTVDMIVPRRGASAMPLPNGQIIITGGLDENGDAVATVELFTPFQ